MTIMPSRERFRGCLVGQALGDALGFVVEGRPPEVCARYLDEGPGGHDFGQYSDDTQLARELMRSYADLGRFEPADYARRIRDIFSEGRIVGYGRSTAQAAGRLVRDVPWDEAGTPPPSAGNGSAMRAGPIGLFFHDDPEGLVRAATQQGIITHADPRCSAGAIAIAGAVSLVLSDRPVDPAFLLDRLAGLTGEVEPRFAANLRELLRWLSLPPEEAVTRISGTGLDPDQGREWQGIPPFVVSSVLWSLYSFLTSPEDYWRAIRTAIAVGGDVDTTAAMAGAISGAHLGLDSLPGDLTRHLTDRGTWGLADLIRLADECHSVRVR
ncbi:MAG TPA: ADP-ribosylglycohydrolase family protein [Rubrobacteraceae bacterium]|nr:ADP-ribosylglycohydrolase family protein [Rubrobacteraceae bacterium]